ncbi:MAG: magnesium/cobalt transporter CorA [Brumimicrobium sp.]|nr:magnesium/cobalt transporter CorA [Brumimicrobium sp.]
MKKHPKKKKHSTFTKHNQKLGMPPGILFFTGDQKTENTSIQLIEYNETDIAEYTCTSVDEATSKITQSEKFYWLNIEGLHNINLIEEIVSHFKLHKLSGEDIVSVQQRPKLDFYNHYIHIILKNIQILPNEIGEEQISILFLENVLISFQERKTDIFTKVRTRLFDSVGYIRTRKTDYLAYALMDVIIDNYFKTVELFDTTIDKLENSIEEMNPQDFFVELVALRRQIFQTRQTIFPILDAANQFSKLESNLVNEETRLFTKDMSENIVQILDMLNSFRENANSLLDIYNSNTANRMNNIMKLLTIVSTIFIPLTFIVGVYGMNFHNMPELSYHYGYLFTWITMVIITIGMIIFFKIRKWL